MRRFINILDNGQNRSNDFIIAQNTRLDIIGELEAIIQYENHLQENNSVIAQKTLRDIVDEEKVHVGQLFGLLFKYDPDSRVFFEKGMKEFQDDDKMQ